MTPEETSADLKSRLEHLLQERRSIIESLDVAVNVSNFARCINGMGSVEAILKEAALRVRSIIAVRSICFYVIAEDQEMSFRPVHCDPAGTLDFYESEKIPLIQDRTVAWALRREKPVIVSSSDRTARIMLHALSTPTSILGLCMAELDDYNLEVLELPYYPGTERGQAETLNACFEQYGGKIDALLTIGPTEDTARRAVQRYSSAGTPVFFACDDAEGCGRIACVQADHDMAGRIAAELLSAQLSPGDAVLLCAGDAHTPSHYRMAAGFEAYLRENSVPLTLVRADGYHDKQELALRLRRTLAEDARISGAFSVSARLSVLLADAVAQMGRAGQVRVVASDLFGKTVRNMEEGLVQNILYKDPAQQGYLAARLMGDFVLRGIQPPAGVHYVESRVIFKSSLAYYRASGAVCP